MTERLSYRVHEAAEATGLSTRTIWRLIASAELPARKANGTTLIRAEDLKAYVDGAPPVSKKSAQS
jgi:excisionase family DNA binding protein